MVCAVPSPHNSKCFEAFFLLVSHLAERSWSVVLALCYAQQKEEMQAVELEPQLVAHLISILQKCRCSKNPDEAKRLHAYLRRNQLESHHVLGNYLVPLLAECGGLSDAQLIFDKLSCPNEYSWTSLICGYIDCGNAKHAHHLYHAMQQKAYVQPNRCTYLALLNACARLKDADGGQVLHAEITKRGLDSDVFSGSALIGNTLVDMYGKCGSFEEACQVFDALPLRNTVSWASLIAGHAEQGRGKEARKCLEKMQSEGISPDPVAFSCCLKAYGGVGSLKMGQETHAEITKRGFDRDQYVGNMLMDMYTECHSLGDAYRLFDQLASRDVVSWNSLIAAYAEHGPFAEQVLDCYQRMQLDGLSPDSVTFACTLKACCTIKSLETGQAIHAEISKRGLDRELYMGNTLVDMFIECGWLVDAHWVFDHLPVRDIVSWNVLITGYIEHELDCKVLSCFDRMPRESVSPDSITFLCSLKACGTGRAVEIGRAIHVEISKRGLDRDVQVGNSLVAMYTECGLLIEAREVFFKLPIRDVVSWTAVIRGYGENGQGDLAVQCFEDMKIQGLAPDPVIFTSLLTACSQCNMVVKGQELFQIMRDEHRIEPTLDHCGCMIDLYARSGHVEEAEKFTAVMMCPPSTVIVLALLSACKAYGKVELGQTCFHHLLELNQEDASAYLLMADIYATAGRFSDALGVEQIRMCARASKKPGNALIEVDRNLYEFVVGVKQSSNLIDELNIWNSRIISEGYVPNVGLISNYTSVVLNESVSLAN